MLRHLY